MEKAYQTHGFTPVCNYKVTKPATCLSRLKLCENTFEAFYYHLVLTCSTVNLLKLIGTINLPPTEFTESPIKAFILNTVKGERLLNQANIYKTKHSSAAAISYIIKT